MSIFTELKLTQKQVDTLKEKIKGMKYPISTSQNGSFKQLFLLEEIKGDLCIVNHTFLLKQEFIRITKFKDGCLDISSSEYVPRTHEQIFMPLLVEIFNLLLQFKEEKNE